MKKISTTALGKLNGIPSKDCFTALTDKGYVLREDDSWNLTESGEAAGGEYKESKQYGKYIVWPEDLLSDQSATAGEKSDLINATKIGNEHGLSAVKINFVFSELGWLKRSPTKGWLITPQGTKQGGVQDEDKKSGIPFVRWPASILESKSLLETIEQLKGNQESKNVDETIEIDFRHKFEAKHRSTDGHFVRSKAEMLIDNYLYMAGIVHAYERKLPIEEEQYSDFYIPSGNVYIEYWGYENEEKYLARKKIKIEIYEKYGFNLIQLQDKEVQNLDDYLPRALLKFGVQAY